MSNSSIYQNHAFSRAELTAEYATCVELCFIPEEYKTHSNDNFGSIILDQEQDQLFQVISGTLSIISNSRIYDEAILINAFVSTVTFEDSLIENITFAKTSIQSVFSNLTLRNMVINNLNNTLNADFILVMLDSHLVISSLVYSNSDSILFKVRTSSIEISGITFSGIQNASKLGEINGCFDSTIEGISSSNTQISLNEMFTVSETNNISFTNIEIMHSQSLAILVELSNVTLVENLRIQNCSEGLMVKSSTITSIMDSMITHSGGIGILYGGALRITDSVVDIQNISFTNNTAVSGGAVYFTCSSMIL